MTITLFGPAHLDITLETARYIDVECTLLLCNTGAGACLTLVSVGDYLFSAHTYIAHLLHDHRTVLTDDDTSNPRMNAVAEEIRKLGYTVTETDDDTLMFIEVKVG